MSSTVNEPAEFEGFCESQVRVTMAVIDDRDLVFLWSCLQHADQFALDLEEEFGMVPERAALGSESMGCGHQGRRAMASMVLGDDEDEPSDVIEIDMDAVRAFNRGGDL